MGASGVRVIAMHARLVATVPGKNYKEWNDSVRKLTCTTSPSTTSNASTRWSTPAASRPPHSLHRSHPAVFAAVARLERQLGLVLLERGGYRVGLTAAGRSFHQRAQALLYELEGLRDHAAHLAQGEESELRVVLATSARRARPWRCSQVLRQPAADPPAIAVRNRQRPAGAPAGRRGRPDPASRGQVRPTPGMARPVQGRAGPGHRAGPARRSSAATGAPGTTAPLRPVCVMRDSARHSSPTDYFMLAGARQCSVPDQRTKKEVILQGLGWGTCRTSW